MKKMFAWLFPRRSMDSYRQAELQAAVARFSEEAKRTRETIVSVRKNPDALAELAKSIDRHAAIQRKSRER